MTALRWAPLLLALSLALPPAVAAPAPRPLAPDFTLQLAEGGTMKLSSLRGRPVVVTFWAFWCTTWQEVCRGYRELSRHDVPAKLIVVAVDATRSELLRDPEHGFDRWFPILIDRERRVSERYRIDCVPTVLVLDSEGRIRYRARGWPGVPQVEQAVIGALKR